MLPPRAQPNPDPVIRSKKRLGPRGYPQVGIGTLATRACAARSKAIRCDDSSIHNAVMIPRPAEDASRQVALTDEFLELVVLRLQPAGQAASTPAKWWARYSPSAWASPSLGQVVKRLAVIHLRKN